MIFSARPHKPCQKSRKTGILSGVTEKNARRKTPAGAANVCLSYFVETVLTTLYALLHLVLEPYTANIL